MAKRYIKLYATPPPGKSIAVDDLDNRQPIAAGDVPEAKWDVEREDGTVARMTGQQLIDQVASGTPETGGSGRPAEIEIEDTDTGIRIRGKSGDATEFGPWFNVRDGRDAEIQIEDIANGIRIRGKSGDETDFGPWHEVHDGMDRRGGDGASQFYGALTPFPNSLGGRYYGSLRPFSKHSLNPFPHHLDDKFYGSMLGFQSNPNQKTADDILRLLEGKREYVADWIWDLIEEQVQDLITE